MNVRKLNRLVMALAAVVAVSISPAVMANDSASTSAGKFSDPLDSPSQLSEHVAQSLLMAITRAGERLVAVGQRGHIIYSDDQGRSWVQAAVPVSSDLTSVYFVNKNSGWAVGHDGVILHSQDGGRRWSKQLDGRQANHLLLNGMAPLRMRMLQDPRVDELMSEVLRFNEDGPDKPFLDVWFADENHGYAIGAYNLIFRTEDGGQNWISLFDKTDNPGFYHLNAVIGWDNEIYIAGEQGLLLRYDAESQRFVALDTPYIGSFFALAHSDHSLVAFGMRGNIYRSVNEGETWQRSKSETEAGFSDVVVLDSGYMVAVSQAGQVLLSKDMGVSFKLLNVQASMPYSSITVAGDYSVAITGTRGVQIVRLP
tara:strand:- start:14268 stop:15371 length:1104 start_codon:yes stop_codon:yes gene_type:complete